MKLVLLAGNSLHNRAWIKKVERKLRPLFSSTYVHEYEHWKNGTGLMNVSNEIERLSKKLERDMGYIVFAKSAGSALALKAIKEKRITPKKCMLASIPLFWAQEFEMPVEYWLEEYKTPTYFIQSSEENARETSALKELLRESKIRKCKVISIKLEKEKGEEMFHLKKHMARLIKN